MSGMRPWRAAAVAALVLSSISLFATAVLYVRSSAHTDSAIRAYAAQQAAGVNAQSRARAVDVCNRANASRAYLRLRALEFVRTDKLKSSYTTQVSPVVLAILNCERTVGAHGRPIPLDVAVQAAYLHLFLHRRVARIVAGRIVGSWPFATYFGR